MAISFVRMLAVTVLLASASKAALAVAQTVGDSERDVRAAMKEFQDANTRKDRAKLERLIAPEFTAIDRAGTVRNRAAWIDGVVSGAMLAQKSVPEELSDELAVFGSTAAARTTVFRYQELARLRDICIKTRTVYARFDGEWRVISTQQTQLHDGPIVTASYDDVVGTYRLDNTRSFTVSRVGRTLFAALPTGVANVPLFETPDGGLVGPGGEFVYTLERNAAGRTAAVTMTRYGKQLWRANRVP